MSTNTLRAQLEALRDEMIEDAAHDYSEGSTVQAEQLHYWANRVSSILASAGETEEIEGWVHRCANAMCETAISFYKQLPDDIDPNWIPARLSIRKGEK
jgi:hypothetical protein